MRSSLNSNRFLQGKALFLALMVSAVPAFALQNPPDGGCFVYPSPAAGNSAWAVYTMPGGGTAQIGVYNEAGDLVAQQAVLNSGGLQQTFIDLTHYRAGIYLCRIQLFLDSGGIQTLKLFKFVVTR